MSEKIRARMRQSSCNAVLNVLAAVVAMSTMALPVIAQVNVPINVHEEGDGPTTTLNLPPSNPIHFQELDTVVHPTRPELGQTNLLPERIAHEFINVMSIGAYNKAEELGKTLVALAPDRPGSHYNLACAYARQKKVDEAFDSLSISIELGWRNAAHMTIDADLDALRDDARFDAQLTRLRELAALEAVVPTPLREEDWQTIAIELESSAPALMERYHVPGMAVALIRGGKVVWINAFGSADVRQDAEEAAITTNTLFRVPAATHLLTAITAAKLAEQGVWSLDDPLSAWLPDLSFANKPVDQEITIRRLLNHTAGLTFDAGQHLYAGVDDEIRFGLMINEVRVADRYTYCPRAFTAVGRAIEEAIETQSQSSDDAQPKEEFDGFFAELMRGNVLRPLGMQHTLPRFPTSDRYQVATGHTEFGTPYRVHIAAPTRPASPFYSSTEDLGKLLAFLMSDVAHEANAISTGRQPLSTDGIAVLTEPGLTDADTKRGFGLGMQVIETAFGKLCKVVDTDRGSGTLLQWYPETGNGIVVLYNSATGTDAAARLAHLALGGSE